MANCQPELRSEVAAACLKRHPEAKFAAVYYMEDGQKMWSVRSRGDFDVNEIAKQFGGGGHAAAAGFKDPGATQAVVLNPPSA